MPKVFDASDRAIEEGKGWMRIILASDQAFGDSVMVAERWIFEPGAQGPERVQGQSDQLLYVIQGNGVAVVDGNELAVEPESMLWLEPGDRYYFEAGSRGLEILRGYAPGEGA